MTETERLLQLLDDAIAAAKGACFAHSLKTRDLQALRALIAELAQAQEAVR